MDEPTAQHTDPTSTTTAAEAEQSSLHGDSLQDESHGGSSCPNGVVAAIKTPIVASSGSDNLSHDADLHTRPSTDIQPSTASRAAISADDREVSSDQQEALPSPPAPTHQVHPADDERDATELRSVTSNHSARSTADSNLHRYYSYEARRTPLSDSRWEKKIAGPARKWWRRNVQIAVPAKWSRDHLAHERTFLGYLRTSVALSMTGITVAQLFRLQHVAEPNTHFGYYKLGIPLAATFLAAAILVCLLGAFRFWRQQNALVRGKCLAGGWEVYGVMACSILLTAALFAVTVGADVEKEL